MARPDPLIPRPGTLPVPLADDLTAHMMPADVFLIQDAEVTAREILEKLREGQDVSRLLGREPDDALTRALEIAPHGVRQWLRAAVMADRLTDHVTGARVADKPDGWEPDLAFFCDLMRSNAAVEILFAAISIDLQPVLNAGNV